MSRLFLELHVVDPDERGPHHGLGRAGCKQGAAGLSATGAPMCRAGPAPGSVHAWQGRTVTPSPRARRGRGTDRPRRQMTANRPRRPGSANLNLGQDPAPRRVRVLSARRPLLPAGDPLSPPAALAERLRTQPAAGGRVEGGLLALGPAARHEAAGG